MNCIERDRQKDLVLAQFTSVMISQFTLKSKSLGSSKNVLDPTVFVVVRNELERMKIFFKNYGKLGDTQFVVLANGSDDGTLEFLMSQENTKVYQVLNGFQTQKKERWVEKLLAMEGRNPWCIVLDSDEL